MAGTIENLIDETLHIVESDANQTRLRHWETSLVAPQVQIMGDSYRGVPPEMTPRPSTEGVAPIPYTVDFGWSIWVQLVGMDVTSYYRDPETFVEAELRKKIYRFENLDDDTYIDPVISVMYGFAPAIESSLFGLKPIYDGENTPWVFNQPVVMEESDLDSLPRIDFQASGMMPEIHRWYREVIKLAGGKLQVRFPVLLQRAFGTAVQLRGFENLMMDFIDRPQFVHRLLDFITQQQKAWERERARFLDARINHGYLHNDDIGHPTLSPAYYRTFVLPYDKEMGEFFGRSYWHSCSNTTPLLEEIARIPGLSLFHVGPWTDREKAAAVLCPRVGLEVCLDPEKLLRASEDEMRAELEELAALGERVPIVVRADCFFPKRADQEHAVRQVSSWALQARLALQAERRSN